MSYSSVVLHNTGRWNDEVGSSLLRSAEYAVSQFNEAANVAFDAIEKVDSYNESDVHYESHHEQLLRMKVNFNG